MTEKSFSLGALEIHAKDFGYSDEPQIEEIIKQVHKQAMAIFPLFEMTFEEERDYLEIIEDARSALINLSTQAIKELVEQKKQIGMLREQAMRDSLTNLLNYKSFHHSLNKECYRAKRYNVPLALIIADIDHFKKVNDTYGHQAGDHVLLTVAQELSKSLRNSDSIARHGGEEFGIILPETTLDNAIAVADRLRHAVESLPIEHEGNKMSITVSFGIASLSSEGSITKEELIRRADEAVYRAKSSGKNRCCVFDDSKPGTKAQSNAKIRVVK
jgi:diguanylate cyclase (GGDEF)-like protein